MTDIGIVGLGAMGRNLSSKLPLNLTQVQQGSLGFTPTIARISLIAIHTDGIWGK